MVSVTVVSSVVVSAVVCSGVVSILAGVVSRVRTVTTTAADLLSTFNVIMAIPGFRAYTIPFSST